MERLLTVGELVDTLKKYPREYYVALSKDSEGNAYSIMMDRQCIMDGCFLEKDLGSQFDYYEKDEVIKAITEGKLHIKHKYCSQSARVNNLVPVIILFGSN